ncbi:tRNA (adenosine(37)-N6)-threonylcarbamoyltransferase complex ATPase subunit type 1 TsaE [Erysipelotrichaceae bacterium OttesenSCG-928-M19]|nr:tRNA (adenosine(37)-N6)-threonylcarbamoyltransferase complex ATPase subunit type 1 TsaE [Erysipelotrichaceae bacterium OttesenSCG-928-M19]
MQKLKLKIKNLVEMEELAQSLALYFNEQPGIIFLDGDLGAGKTTFTQFFAKEIGVQEVVTSPTFNIFKRYQGSKRYLNHFDLYRIKDNVYDQGFEEYWDSMEDITIIEWSKYLPNEFKSLANLHLTIKIIDEDKREIAVLAKNSIILFLEENNDEFIY